MYGAPPLWPLPVAPPLPTPDGAAYHVVKELSGPWQGGLIPSYNEQPWQVERLVEVTEPGWLYVYDVQGAFSLYLDGMLMYRGDTHHLAIRIETPSRLKIRIKGKSSGGVIGGVYLYGQRGPVAWPIDTNSRWLSRTKPKPSPTLAAASKEVRRGSPPLWALAAIMGLWGTLAAYGASFREAHWQGPWTKRSPMPLESLFSAFSIAFCIATIWQENLLFFLGGSLVELFFAIYYRIPLEKLWQSWLPISLVVLIFYIAWPQGWWGWLAWAARTGLLAIRFPEFLYLCTGYLSFYFLIRA